MKTRNRHYGSNPQLHHSANKKAFPTNKPINHKENNKKFKDDAPETISFRQGQKSISQQDHKILKHVEEVKQLIKEKRRKRDALYVKQKLSKAAMPAPIISNVDDQDSNITNKEYIPMDILEQVDQLIKNQHINKKIKKVIKIESANIPMQSYGEYYSKDVGIPLTQIYGSHLNNPSVFDEFEPAKTIKIVKIGKDTNGLPPIPMDVLAYRKARLLSNGPFAGLPVQRQSLLSQKIYIAKQRAANLTQLVG